MTRRSAWKPTYVAQPETSGMTFAQKHPVVVAAIELKHPHETYTLRFTNERRAIDSVVWHTENGYFASIV